MEDRFVKQMREECGQFDITLEDHQLEQFYQYYELLIHWNSMMNLTAITELSEVVTKHFVDSLSLIRVIPDIKNKPLSLIDVGTGAGFPGIPLKIAFPNLNVTLLDSLKKRVNFLDETIAQLELENVNALHGRAEDFGRDDVSRETFDLCVSRAVANLSTLSEYCMPLVKIGGYFVPYKSGKLEEELKIGKRAVKLLGGQIEDTVRFQLPNADERILVKIRKVENTSKKYPRKAGIPSKDPLH
ncbi:MAG: 16S rRNA (guanine(527)-N(7))-methyltransferase RsmG [Clostridiaceae bacterium]|nr:16S rRNA (guanine(527)-N(7))-methyltransferase RsmG [Clostridiaceae bacterium]